MSSRPFHLAFPVDDLGKAKAFYLDVLGCGAGRSSERWHDFDLFGHQVVAQLVEKMPAAAGTNRVHGHDVPVPHFGVVLSVEQFEELAERVRAAGVRFIIEPYTRFPGEPGEQRTMFFADPAGNALEFKAFADPAELFAT